MYWQELVSRKACAACQIPSQSKFFADWFPYKENKISLFEAICGIAHDETLRGGDIPSSAIAGCVHC